MHEHIDSIKTYTLVFLSLLALTAATTVVAYRDLGQFNVVMALFIAVVVGGGMLWLGILLVLSLADFVTRGWLPVPGK
jgi:cytochrome c oxidase subunit 4